MLVEDEDSHYAGIRSPIKPYCPEAHYPTGWNGAMTFAEIRDVLTPSMNRLMRYYRYVEVDIPDMMAHGFMRLWEELSAHPDFLAQMDQGGAVKWVMYRSGISHYRKFYRREMYLEDLATRSGDPDEFVIDGYDHQHRIGHATYAEAIDLRIDIEQALKRMADKYQHSLAHLAALYYITTSVGLEDAAQLAGRGGSKTCWWLTKVVKPMREELCELLSLARPGKTTWQEQVPSLTMSVNLAPSQLPNGTRAPKAWPHGPNGSVSARHGEMANFAFCDGHVKPMRPADTNPDPLNRPERDLWDATRR